jgi:hypothetical protein
MRLSITPPCRKRQGVVTRFVLDAAILFRLRSLRVNGRMREFDVPAPAAEQAHRKLAMPPSLSPAAVARFLTL